MYYGFASNLGKKNFTVNYRILGKAQAAYSISFPGRPAVVHKGKLEGIHISVTQRASNKKVIM